MQKIGSKPLSDYTYRFAPDLWVITAYYNPAGFQTRRRNYEVFAEALRQSGIPLLTVECAFGNQPYDLPESVDVIRVRSESMLWQKERLLNLGISWLPSSCKYVAWLDCDVIFKNLDWAQETAAKLQKVPLVQVFETCNRMPQNYEETTDGGSVCSSFAGIVGKDAAVLKTGHFEDHGHTGYGWAARKSLLDTHGLYEYAIAGSADHYMAHAALGDLDSPCIERMMLKNSALIGHFRDWSTSFYGSVRGGLGVVRGEVLHLWHGDLENRKYFLRHVELADRGFNPYTDLIDVPGKPLELRDSSGLTEWFRSYFQSRHEDGVNILKAA